ncbi:nitroreductase/quinone reductase family protein [Gordonia sp. (in: high G+C Gram-positive bacteria)]|uniref:nitroreductase/quinone reductase family protein n=1 Tax=Gordonia sp. (in: high G+C Gram-positive bacteria) TaxID=84139 RepID=UPI0016B4879E|nr:nitroreductase/quinone reductase family protein [Gordonia sp. (in: high G+C Gram-positive bacteria)]NLG46336.1 nitroreductase family deazaflavin-dependent oxidoreductase [Gordonia sp. (in: high G+C Gram-positive bacteria)]
MGVLTPVAIRIGSFEWLPKYLPYIVKIDVLLHFLTRGRVGLLRLAGLPGVTMTIPGRKSGTPHSTHVLAAPDGDDWLVAGSFFGGPKTPVWVYNLRAAETITVTVNGVSQTMARTELVDNDRAVGWRILLGVWPNFTMYARRTDRRIPVFRLSPV